MIEQKKKEAINADEAFAWLEKEYVQSGAGSWSAMATDDLLISLHQDPRWPSYLAKLGIPAEQRQAIEFEVELPR